MQLQHAGIGVQHRLHGSAQHQVHHLLLLDREFGQELEVDLQAQADVVHRIGPVVRPQARLLDAGSVEPDHLGQHVALGVHAEQLLGDRAKAVALVAAQRADHPKGVLHAPRHPAVLPGEDAGIEQGVVADRDGLPGRVLAQEFRDLVRFNDLWCLPLQIVGREQGHLKTRIENVFGRGHLPEAVLFRVHRLEIEDQEVLETHRGEP